jgi:hypothetical protein
LARVFNRIFWILRLFLFNSVNSPN